ncbi:PWWP domain [Trinorchestia longiramus]|nr:PWWP domain [Trinorchestia longiramus]
MVQGVRDFTRLCAAVVFEISVDFQSIFCNRTPLMEGNVEDPSSSNLASAVNATTPNLPSSPSPEIAEKMVPDAPVIDTTESKGMKMVPDAPVIDTTESKGMKMVPDTPVIDATESKGMKMVPDAPVIDSTASKGMDKVGLYNDGVVVWVRLGQSWWPGSVVGLHSCPADFLGDLKKTPLAVVKFFEENEFVDIHKREHIYPYNCERKNEFIKKGLSFHEKRMLHSDYAAKNNLRSMQNKEELFKKFELDVLTAEKLTGGESDVFTRIEEDSNKRRIDYSNLGFGPPKPKKKKEEERTGVSDISEAVHYKKACSTWPSRQMKLEHKVVIMEQPHVENMKEDLQKSCNHYKCNLCNFTCSRLGVIVWHNKGHLKTIINYDTGIRIPGRKRRKQKAKSKKKVQKVEENGSVDHSKSNGHVAGATGSVEAKQLLLDWDDEEEAAGDARDTKPLNNGGQSSDDASESDEVEDCDEYRQPRGERIERRPMRAAEELNSAFDALLADTPSSASLSTSASSFQQNYVNNQSDSDASDWEKYYDKSSGDEHDDPKESDIKSLCEASDDSDGIVSSTVTNGTLHTLPSTQDKEDDVDSTSVNESLPVKDAESVNSNSASPEQSNQEDFDGTEAGDDDEEEDEDEDGDTKETGRSSSLSSSPSNSGPAFMLVAVDAHGNNVPMPALTDRNHSSNLVAVEASMEDGTSRTLYIDPAYLEPNVDLSNLMLHIDNSGQETVIIPSTAATDTAANATPPQDSMSSSSSSSSNSVVYETPQQESSVVASEPQNTTEVSSSSSSSGGDAPALLNNQEEASSSLASSSVGADVHKSSASAAVAVTDASEPLATTLPASDVAPAVPASVPVRRCDLDAVSEASGVVTTLVCIAKNASYLNSSDLDNQPSFNSGLNAGLQLSERSCSQQRRGTKRARASCVARVSSKRARHAARSWAVASGDAPILRPRRSGHRGQEQVSHQQQAVLPHTEFTDSDPDAVQSVSTAVSPSDVMLAKHKQICTADGNSPFKSSTAIRSKSGEPIPQPHQSERDELRSLQLLSCGVALQSEGDTCSSLSSTAVTSSHHETSSSRQTTSTELLLTTTPPELPLTTTPPEPARQHHHRSARQHHHGIACKNNPRISRQPNYGRVRQPNYGRVRQHNHNSVYKYRHRITRQHRQRICSCVHPLTRVARISSSRIFFGDLNWGEIFLYNPCHLCRLMSCSHHHHLCRLMSCSHHHHHLCRLMSCSHHHHLCRLMSCNYLDSWRLIPLILHHIFSIATSCCRFHCHYRISQ